MDMVDLMLIAGGGIDNESLDNVMEAMNAFEESTVPPP